MKSSIAALDPFAPASNQEAGGNSSRLPDEKAAWWRTLKLAWARWAQEDGDQRAAAFVYYMLLSLMPLALLLVAAGSLVVERDEAAQAIIKFVNHYTPLTSEQEHGAVVAIRDWLKAGGTMSLVAVPILVWGTMKYLRTLTRTTNRIWQFPTHNWWRLPLKSLGLLGITVSAVLIGILLPAVARLAGQWLTTHLAFPLWVFALVFQLIPGLVLFYGVIMIYKLAPSRHIRYSDVWQGALAATMALWLGQRLFLYYATNHANFDALYGALGGIVAFLLLLYLSSSVVVFGICLCAARTEVREQVNPQPEKTRE